MTKLAFLALLLSASMLLAQTKPQPQPRAQHSDASELHRHNGSLLKAGAAASASHTANTKEAENAPAVALKNSGFFAVPAPEPRTIKKHDLVQIIVREESEVSSDGTTETSKSHDLDAAIENYIKLNLADFSIEGAEMSGEPLAIRYNGSRNFSGEGSVERSDSFVTRIAAEVVDVKPNGNLILQARSHVMVDEEEQLIILTGTCRAEDISIDNTLLSNQLYDLRLQKKHKGAIRDANKRGIVPKLLDLLNPF